jgi:hypothetical protein
MGSRNSTARKVGNTDMLNFILVSVELLPVPKTPS